MRLQAITVPLDLWVRTSAERVLGEVCITCNKNSIPDDPQKPVITSGIRLGSPAITTRGFGIGEAYKVGNWVADVVQAPQDLTMLTRVRDQVRTLCQQFPVYR